MLLEKKNVQQHALILYLAGNSVDRDPHCGERLFFVQKLHFAVEFSIEVSDIGRCSLKVKNMTNFQKTC